MADRFEPYPFNASVLMDAWEGALAKHMQARVFYLSAPVCAMGEKIDFVYLIATLPGRHCGAQVHKVKKTAAPLNFCLLAGDAKYVHVVSVVDMQRPAEAAGVR